MNRAEKINKFAEKQLWGFSDDHKETIKIMMDRSADIIINNSTSDEVKINEIWTILTILAEQMVK